MRAKRIRTSKGDHKRKGNVLIPCKLPNDRSKWKLEVIDISAAAMQQQQSRRSTTQKRSKKQPSSTNDASDNKFVVLWPQYTCAYTTHVKDHVDETWVLVAITEGWFKHMVSILKPAGSAQDKGADKRRKLESLLTFSIKNLLTRALVAAGRTDALEDSPQDSCTSLKRLPRSKSGHSIDKHNVWHVDCEGYKVAILNYGRQMVLKLDDHGMRFIEHALPQMILRARVDVGTPSTDIEHERACTQESPIKFDRSIKNIDDRVVWQERDRCFQLKYKGVDGQKLTGNKDANEPPRKLELNTNLTGDKLEHARWDLYHDAIAAWNLLDRSNRRRLTIKNDVSRALSSPDKEASRDTAKVLSLTDKWGADDCL